MHRHRSMLYEKGIGIAKPFLIRMNLTPNARASARARINIRKVNANDLKAVLNLFARHMNIERERISAFRKRSLLSYILSVPFGLLGEDTFIGSIAETDDGHIVSAVFARRFPFGKSWIIGPVVCHVDFRHLGITTHMMNWVMKYLREKKTKSVIVSVERSNIGGIRFFKKFGFKYLEPVFDNHERARNYVRTIALIHGYLRNPSYKIERCPPPRARANFDLPRIRKTRMWCVMLKEFKQIPRANSTSDPVKF